MSNTIRHKVQGFYGGNDLKYDLPCNGNYVKYCWVSLARE